MGRVPFISKEEQFSLVSSDDEEPLSRSQPMDEKDAAAAEHNVSSQNIANYVLNFHWLFYYYCNLLQFNDNLQE